jgi:hypothetical protein
MRREDFLNSSSVKAFIEWLEARLDKDKSFVHAYDMKKPAEHWKCTSIRDAYKNYKWPFSFTDPADKKKKTGSSFDENAAALNNLSDGLEKSLEKNSEDCRAYCYAILQWGGVLPQNRKRIDGLGDGICDYLKKVKVRFDKNLSSDEYYDQDLPSDEYYDGKMIMTSGFSKIYSLCIDNFIIYDGRVGAALGLLVRKFCEEKNLENVPAELCFAWGKKKENPFVPNAKDTRNPSFGKYQFPELASNPKRHIDNNVRANWLLAKIAGNTDFCFKSLDLARRMRALESALFMIGYKVN